MSEDRAESRSAVEREPRAHAIFACPSCDDRVAVTNPASLQDAVVLCHCNDNYPRMEHVDGSLEVRD